MQKQPAPDFTVRVLNYHLDGYGHVNNARYLEFLEAARWHFFEHYQLLGSLRQAQLVVARADIRYRRAAKLDETLHIRSRLQSVQSRQIILTQQVVEQAAGSICATAEITLVPTNADGKMCRLPDALHTLLTHILETP